MLDQIASLKRKLHRKRIPTGYPNIPTNVLHAKHVRMEMTRRVDLGDIEGADVVRLAVLTSTATLGDEERLRREEDREAERRQRQEDQEEERKRHQELIA
ncbi:uncharacterized protein PITG_08706 [Phytophthora infestans T30-4]|uniref:Uncharacterized protein n=1 Tax=Phytophthora infestans (strain T30-4) TaxID=403677 RepID=D0ND03_PHYIT|nr:uncharacterized protein PITG_08706 [Phytophthora infestans T30-4]EEY55960.1 hypothetical protein PITG_08706 [Phytophthora infestans T30-4]|eukprot:XP_002902790.1 hypothetical protein PITG_08706 [Phytophthora infestans T30-4]